MHAVINASIHATPPGAPAFVKAGETSLTPCAFNGWIYCFQSSKSVSGFGYTVSANEYLCTFRSVLRTEIRLAVVVGLVEAKKILGFQCRDRSVELLDTRCAPLRRDVRERSVQLRWRRRSPVLSLWSQSSRCMVFGAFEIDLRKARSLYPT